MRSNAILNDFKKQAHGKIIFILKILIFTLLLFTGQGLRLYAGDSGCKYFKNFSSKDYDHFHQNWGIAQAKNGIIYVANGAGVLIYDGVSWRVVYEDIPNYTVNSLAIAETGTVYIGGKNEIGYLAANEKGTLHYVSLVNKLDESQRNFADVWKTHAAKEGVYFRTSKFLFRWDSEKMKVWTTDRKFNGSFLCRGSLFINRASTGLMRIVNDSPEALPGGEIFASDVIYFMAPYNTDAGGPLLIGARSKGLFLYDGTNMEPFPTKVGEYIKNNRASHGIRTSGGDFALATNNGGLLIMDARGGLKRIVDKRSGLQDQNVRYVFEDKQGSLWLALDRGISRIEYSSPFFLYDDRAGLPGIVISVVRHRGDLYAGTSQGLYVLRPDEKIFRPILLSKDGIPGNCSSLLSVDHSLLIAATAGVFQVDIKKNISRKVLGDRSYVLVQSRRAPGAVWCGTTNGLALLTRKNGGWELNHRFKTITQEIHSIVEEPSGSLWLGAAGGNFLQVDFKAAGGDPVISTYTAPDSAAGEAYVARAAGHVVFAADKGLFRFDKKKNTLIPDPLLGERFTGGKNGKPVFRIIEDRDKNIWFHSESKNYRAVPGPDGTFRIDAAPFCRIPTTAQVNAIYPDPDGENAWFAGMEGLIRYDATVKKNYRQDFNTLLRKIYVNERLIFDGHKTGEPGGPGADKTTPSMPIFEYAERNLHFEFATPFFEAEDETLYRFFLEGYEANWSNWKKGTQKYYTNLDAGVYRFRVQSKNIYGILSPEEVFQFKILLPWYRTWWAFLSYFLVPFMLMYLVGKWRRSVRLEKEAYRLEQIIKERTGEIKEKNRQLQEQTQKLQGQSEKLKEMDKVKSRFFTNISHEFRTPLTLIMSPLEQMRSRNRDKGQEKKFALMLRNSRHLLTLINQLLDLSRFDSGSMKLQASRQNIVSFLKEAAAAFQELAEKNKLALDFSYEEEEISLYFDAQKMTQVINNLLINAVKFTPEGGKITLSVSRQTRQGSSQKEDDFIIISVRDTGIGIPKEYLPNIFDRFYQAKSFKKNSLKGTGIGLALTKEVVLLHHGKIDVHSQEGKGTEFVIQLPLGMQHLREDEIAASAAEVTGLERRGDFEGLTVPGDNDEAGMDVEDEKSEIIEAVPEPTGKPEGEEKNVVLIVEDHSDMRLHIRDTLEPYYTVEEATDGKQGIAKAKEIIPDLIVSDIMMPEMDGYELCRELKKDRETSHIPIILLTAKALEEDTIKGLKTGADDYVTKPFNADILLARIENLIELRRQLQLKIQREKMLLPSEIPVSSMDDEFLKDFQAIIEKNLDDADFGVDELSDKLYMGRSTLFKKIKAITGESPKQFIQSYRLERGTQLLRDKFGNVTEVAMKVGFSTSQYFAKCFREKYHLTPSAFQAAEGKSPQESVEKP